MSLYHAWLFIQDGSSSGLNLNSIGSNLLNNSIEKIVTYKSFLKLIPNPAHDINSKSKIKLLSEWNVSGDYYQIYGWISGQSSKINAHNFEFDDYPEQDFFGDLILFKIDLSTHQILNINENDVSIIDIAKREEEIEEDDDEEENKDNDSDSDNEKGNEDAEEDVDEDVDEEGEEEGDDEEDYDYDDDKVENDEVGDEEEFYDEDDDEDGETSGRSRKKQIPKNNICNFSRLIASNTLRERLDKTYNPENDNEKQKVVIDNFRKLLYPKKEKLTKQDTNVLREIERGIYNWTVREADKKGFMCFWEDRNFIKIYIHKAISIYQNLCSDNVKLVKFAIEGDNGYKLSEMSPTELNPEKHAEIINKIKEKDKVMFEKQKGVGSKHFKCGKCKEKDVSVTTAQTRSGDEGITLFLTCNNCGNQWKMS
jgi:DNA-directed RNA polymerase subunit M/transcription elongation factor TFIIS